MFDNALYHAGEKLLSGTRFEQLGAKIYSTVFGVIKTGSLRGVGTYEVQPTERIDPFPLVMDRPHRRILGGDFEPDVFETLFEHIDSETTYWEVGARWGTFSFALSPHISKAFAFERDPHRVHLLSKSRVENNAENVSIIGADLSENNSLDTYGSPPEIITIDIEGGEYDVLPASVETLAAEPIWIVEAHQYDHITGTPTDLVELFRCHDYNVERFEEDGPRCRLVAKPN